MTVTVSKPALNLREELSALKKPSGIKGEELLRANTVADVYASLNPTMFRNRIINGDMRIDQRNAGASVSGELFAVDRFRSFNQSDGTITSQQVSDAPAGFNYSYKITVNTADTSLGTIQYMELRQNIEGYNAADFGWGTAAAKPVTLSFWVKSSLTGTFGGTFMNSSVNRSHPFSYTISAGNSWEYKTITVPGDTTGTWDKTNGTGMFLMLNLGAGTDWQGTAGAWVGSRKQTVSGAVSLIGTANATWQITGVQVEVGTVATPFEHRPFGTELALCQRYFQTMTFGSGGGGTYGPVSFARNNVTLCGGQVSLMVPMRAAPTQAYTNNSAQIMTADGSTQSGGTIGSSIVSPYAFSYEVSYPSGGLTNGRAYGWYGGSWVVQSNAEL